MHSLRAALVSQMCAAVAAAAVSFLLLLYLARVLGKADFGTYVAILSVAVVALILIEGGWSSRIYRDSVELPGEPGGKSIDVLAQGIGHACLGAVAFALMAVMLAPAQLAWATAMLCMGAVAIANMLSAKMRAAGRFALEAGWQLGGRLVTAALILLVVWMVPGSISAVFAAWLAGLLLMLAVWGRSWSPSSTVLGGRGRWSLTLPFLLVDLVAAIMLKGDVAVLRWAGASTDTLAEYAACTRLNDAALLLFAPLSNVLLRRMRLAAGDSPAFYRLWRTAVSVGVACGLLAVGMSWVFGGVLMPTLFGSAFSSAGDLLGFTSMMLPFALANLILIAAMLARGCERQLSICGMLCAPITAVAIVLGLRIHDGSGAAVGLAAGHALFAVLCVRALRRSAYAA